MIARRVLRVRQRRASTVALQGPLGSGKTTFIQGFFRELGIRSRAVSPTFILIRRIPLSKRKFRNVFHVDAYRIGNRKEVLTLNLSEIFADPTNIVMVEWAERVGRIIPKEAMWLTFEHGRRKNDRMVTVE